jgi:hypothetical protein
MHFQTISLHVVLFLYRHNYIPHCYKCRGAKEGTIGKQWLSHCWRYKDELMVHIREYTKGNDKLYPTRKAVVFNKCRWATFLLHLEDIDKCVQKLNVNKEEGIIEGRYYGFKYKMSQHKALRIRRRK